MTATLTTVSVAVAGCEDRVLVTGEATSDPWFAITPRVSWDREVDELRLAGGLALIHVPSGRCVVTDTVGSRLRKVVPAIAPLLDWSLPDPIGPATEPQKRGVRDAIRIAHADADAVTWPQWAGDDTQPAMSLLGLLLDDAINGAPFSATSRKVRADVVSDVRAAGGDQDLVRRLELILLSEQCARFVAEFGLIGMLAALTRVDQSVADGAARVYVAECENGDSMGEWIHQWRNEIRSGQPLTLHDVPAVFPVQQMTPTCSSGGGA